MKIEFSALRFLFIIFLLGCSEGDDDDGANVNLDILVGELTVLDIENAGDASDIRITFEVAEDESSIDHYRAFLVKSASSASFDAPTAAAVADAGFTRLEKTGSAIDIRLSDSATDVDGDPIAGSQEYAVFVMSVTTEGGTDALQGPAVFTLERTDIVEILTEMPIGTAGIVVDDEGNIYSADFGLSSAGGGSSIYKITPEGNISTFATGFTEASGNTIGPDGTIYQSDFSTGIVSKVSTDGTVTTFATGMTGPVGLTLDLSGNLYVANCLENTIKKVTPSGRVTTYSSGAVFNCPNGITRDNSGNLYVGNFLNGDIIKVSSGGTPAVFATLPGGNGHVIFANGRLYAIARETNQIYQLSLDGEMTKIAGTGSRGHRVGAALDAQFSLPNDIGFSPDGKYIYVNDAVQLTGVPVAPSYLKRIRLEK